MQRHHKAILLIFFCCISSSVMAQVIFDQKFDIAVRDGDRNIAIPWIGGLNSSQYNQVDLDGDGKEELVLYDRSANVYQIFSHENKALFPSNELCALLPEIPAGWVLFVDYDRDGKKDIFSNGSRGIIAYKNLGVEGQPVQWKKMADPLLTTGFSGKINLIANAADVPAIADIDSDGDVDILVYNFAVGGYIRYNKNLSQELFGHSDSLEFEINTRTWGEFEECDCNLFAFSGVTCAELSNGGRVMHPGGKALLAMDMDGDGDKDLLVGHEQCIELYFYENMGNKDSAYMVDFSNMFPNNTQPANFHIFPAGYFEDLDFDGLKDLIVTPSFEENYDFKIDFARSNWFYKNNGTNVDPSFVYQKDNFLQDQMLDFGENSVPAIEDLNADGTQDLLVAANGFWNGSNFSGYVVELINNGSTNTPAFYVNSRNYADLASLELINPNVNLVDFNGDSAIDMVYTGARAQDFEVVSKLFTNQGPKGQPVSFDMTNAIDIQMPQTATFNDNPAFFDLDRDGHVDLLLGKSDGALEYHRNRGDHTFELIDPSYLGIDRDFSQQRRNLVPNVTDIDQDGELDLITTDSRGIGSIYFDFINQTNSDSEAVNIAYKNTLTGERDSIKLDRKSWIATADLYDQGTESIIAGGVRGGLQMYQNVSTGGEGGGDPSLVVNIFPNPIRAYTTDLNIESNQDATMELFTLLGQRMLGSFDVKKFNTSVLDLSHLNNGMYILKSQNDSGIISSQLLMILR